MSDSPPSAAPRASTNRLMSVDAARVIATFGIIWVHVAESQGLPIGPPALGRFGTSFYVIVAALFAVRAVVLSPGQKYSANLFQKTRRLLWPFLVWSTVYGLYYGVRGLRLDYSWKGLTHWWGPLAGTAVHLWFLPFVFTWGVFAIYVVPILLRWSRRQILLCGLLVSGGLYFYCYRRLFFIVDRPWLWSWHLHRLDRWIVEVPLFITALFAAVYFYRLRESTRQELVKRQKAIGFLSSFVFLFFEFVYFAYAEIIEDISESEGRFMANIAGAALFVAFLAFSRGWFARRLAPLGRYTYLAFLAHMLVIEVMRGPIKDAPGYGEVPLAFLCSLIVFSVSLLLSRLIQNLRFLWWLRA